MSLTVAESPDVLEDGTWETRGLIRVWVPTADAAGVVCPTCFASEKESCVTANGTACVDHSKRRKPYVRLCPCGAELARHKKLCEDCRTKSQRQRWRRYNERRRAVA